MRTFLAVIGIASLAGCGGGGGGGAIALASRLRAVQVGDQWHYSVSGQQTAPGVAAIALNGTDTESIVQQTVNGQQVLALSQAFSLNASNGQTITSNSLTYFTQDAGTGDAHIIATKSDNGPVLLVTDSPAPVVYPGAWSPSTAFAYTLHFNDASSSTDTLSVSNSESVGVPLATFMAWKTTTSTSAASGNVNGTDWWAPQLGNIVKSQTTKTFTTGETLTLTEVLTSTNVAF